MLAFLRSRRPRLTYANVVATLALLLALGGTSYAAITVTSANIADETIQSRDVRNGSLTSVDLKDRSVAANDLTAALLRDIRDGGTTTGAQGPAGPAGAPGATGPQGPQGIPGATGSDASIDSLAELEQIPCTKDGFSGHVEVVVGARTSFTAPVTLRCALSPLTCGAAPSYPNGSVTCNGETGTYDYGCDNGFYDPVPVGDACIVDPCASPAPPLGNAHGSYSCINHTWALTCNFGWTMSCNIAIGVPVNDSGSVALNTPWMVPAVQLTGNELTAGGSPVTLSGVGNAVNGTVAYDSSTGQVTFTPTPGYIGPASFTYSVVVIHAHGTHAVQGGTGTVNLDVTP